MERLIEVAMQEGIVIIENAPLPKSYLGLYVQEENYKPSASLSKSIYGQRKMERAVLAEEIGHYFTVVEHNVPRYFKKYSDQLKFSRQEYRAARKGAQLLIYPEEILEAVTHGLEEVWELAEHFDVPEEFMLLRLNVWKISGK